MLLIGKGVEPLRGRMMQNSEDVSLHDLDSIDRCLSCYLLPRRWKLCQICLLWVISGHWECTRMSATANNGHSALHSPDAFRFCEYLI